MDIGIPLIFIPFTLYCLYSFGKSKQNIFLIISYISWKTAIHSGKYNVYQFFEEPLKSFIDAVTIFLFLLAFIPYLKASIRQYKIYKKYSE